VRRAKLYYLRGLTGRAARIKERRRPLIVQTQLAPQVIEEPSAAEYEEPVEEFVEVEAEEPVEETVETDAVAETEEESQA
jgi:hypothetical protein